MHPKYGEMVKRLKAWAEQESKVHSALILGSQVREEFEGDEWSDLDVLLLVDDPQVLLQTDTWLTFFGEAVCGTVEETQLDWLRLTWAVKRVLFADNRAVDFSILPYDRIDDVLSINAEIHAHGYQIIYDDCSNRLASKIETTLKPVEIAFPEIPSEDKLHQTVNDLLFQLMFACKKIKRKELWVAVSCMNQEISRRLLDLIEFHTASIGIVSQKLCYDGRFLEQRARPDILEQLTNCFAKYNGPDAIQTAGHILNTAQYLTKDICEANHYPFDDYPFDKIRKLFRDMFENA
jgi:aminoglycoside 6-adenylyltransferase